MQTIRRWLVPALVALVAGCEEPEPPVPCHGDTECREGLVCKPRTCPDQWTCQRPGDDDRVEAFWNRCALDGRCDADWCESCLACPEDCCVACDRAALVALAPRDFLVSAYQVDVGWRVGLDLDGDGNVENKLGAMINLLRDTGDPDPDQEQAERLLRGESLVALRVHAASLVGDATEVLVQPLLAAVRDATPVYDGHDTVAIAADASRDAFLCGAVVDGAFSSQPGLDAIRFPIPYDLNTGRLVPVWVDRARIEAVIGPEGVPELWIGGGISRSEVDDVLLPSLATVLTRQARANPESLGSYANGSCAESSEPECQAAASGPECAAEDPPVITVTEIRCESLLRSAFSPDLDLDHDGVNESLSFGFRLEAVPVTLVD